MLAIPSYPEEPSSLIGTILAHWHQSECRRELGCGLTPELSRAAKRRGLIQALGRSELRPTTGANAMPTHHRPQDFGSNPKTRSSWSQRQAFAIRAAHAMASSREGNSSTVKPPSSGGTHG